MFDAIRQLYRYGNQPRYQKKKKKKIISNATREAGAPQGEGVEAWGMRRFGMVCDVLSNVG